MQNNPIRYSDPSGHRLVEDFGNGGCSTSGYCPVSSTISNGPNSGGNAGRNNGGNQHPSKGENSVANKDDDTGFITDIILQLPGSSDDWSNLATGLDLLAWSTDLYAAGAVTYAYFGGAALPAPLIAVGLPEVPLVTGLAGMAIAELYVQPVLFTGNVVASFSTGATIVSDTKAGNTRVEEAKFSASVLNSMALTDIGWQSNEAYLSLIIQSVAVANDFQWTSLPFPRLP